MGPIFVNSDPCKIPTSANVATQALGPPLTSHMDMDVDLARRLKYSKQKNVFTCLGDCNSAYDLLLATGLTN